MDANLPSNKENNSAKTMNGNAVSERLVRWTMDEMRAKCSMIIFVCPLFAVGEIEQ